MVFNLVQYVHQSLMPQKAPNDAIAAKGLTKRLWNGWCGPYRHIEEHTFICQSHSLLLGALLRSLGFSVREINILTMPFLGRTIADLVLKAPPQDDDFVKGSPLPTPDQKEKYQVDVSKGIKDYFA